MAIISIVISPYNADKTILKNVHLVQKQFFLILILLSLMMAQSTESFYNNVKTLTFFRVIFTDNIEDKII